MSTPQLWTYYRSSAAWRVRIALALKGLAAEPVFVHLRRGDQFEPDHLARHPLGFVPLLRDGEAEITQSVAIIEYLEETHPNPPLLPADPAARARARAIAQTIACDIHPLNNLRVLRHLKVGLGLDEETRTSWYRRWIAEGFGGLEHLLDDGAPFCQGPAPGYADCFLVPQIYNAERFGCDLTPYPKLRAINEACLALPAFADTAPERQPDAE